MTAVRLDFIELNSNSGGGKNKNSDIETGKSPELPPPFPHVVGLCDGKTSNLEELPKDAQTFNKYLGGGSIIGEKQTCSMADETLPFSLDGKEEEEEPVMDCISSGNSSVPQQRAKPRKGPSIIIRRFLKYCGPGYMIAVGYMDPGNWATDIEAGSRYGYSLLFVILLSNLMAMVLQHLCVRLGVTTRMDLARACRERMPSWANILMYIVAEIAIISCDLAEVIGTAIALKLLFGLPILYGVLLTVCDVLLLLAGLGGASGGDSEAKAYRVLEIIVMALMTVIGGCFMVELFIVKPDWKAVAYGFLPIEAGRLMFDKTALFSALGIIGATVMPHNLYLHSFIVQHRLPKEVDPEANTPLIPNSKDEKETALLKEDQVDAEGEASTPSSIINYATADSTIALFFAMFINAAILITAAAAFHARGKTDVQHIEDASALMREWLGPASAVLFGLALLAAGQSSTVTGTMAGQIVFEGHLKMQMAPWLRRLLTRVVAIVPALLIIWLAGEESINEMLIYSQVILSFQLPFAIIPLIIFAFTPITTSETLVKTYWDERRNSAWEFPLKLVACIIASILIILNILFLFTAVKE